MTLPDEKKLALELKRTRQQLEHITAQRHGAQRG